MPGVNPTGPLRIALVSCEVFTRELSWALSRSPNTVDVVWLPKALHDGPRAAMLEAVQRSVDQARAGIHAAVVIGFGLCGLGLDGLRSRDLPVVVPRAHDCRTLFLGGRAQAEAFNRDHPGRYLFTTGWLERSAGDGRPGMQGWGTGLPSYDDLVRKYGEDNARYLLDTLDPTRHYTSCSFVAMDCGGESSCREQVAAIAAQCGWEYHDQRGDHALLQRLVDGPWDHADLLVMPPRHRLCATHDQRVMDALPEGS